MSERFCIIFAPLDLSIGFSPIPSPFLLFIFFNTLSYSDDGALRIDCGEIKEWHFDGEPVLGCFIQVMSPKHYGFEILSDPFKAPFFPPLLGYLDILASTHVLLCIIYFIAFYRSRTPMQDQGALGEGGQGGNL